MTVIPNYSEYTVEDREWTDRWEYRKAKGYPKGDADRFEIFAFIKDAKEAERKIEEDLVKQGMSKKEAHKVSCQFPLVEDAPMSVVRNFIGYMRSVQDCGEEGIFM